MPVRPVIHISPPQPFHILPHLPHLPHLLPRQSIAVGQNSAVGAPTSQPAITSAAQPSNIKVGPIPLPVFIVLCLFAPCILLFAAFILNKCCIRPCRERKAKREGGQKKGKEVEMGRRETDAEREARMFVKGIGVAV